MVLVKCIIFCLDVIVGCVVKGVNFVELCDVGDFVEIVCCYDDQGVDELIFFDIIVMFDQCDLILLIIEVVVLQVFILLIVGGGVCVVEDVWCLLNVGVDKVSMNLLVVVNLQFVCDVVDKYGL